MKEQLNQLRVDIDGIAQLVYDLQPHKQELSIIRVVPFAIGGYEVQTFQLYEAHKSLLLAKAWIGKLLGTLGSTSPYTNDGKRNSVADIEPTDARAGIINWDTNLNHIQKVDKLRQFIEDTITRVGSLSAFESRESNICRTQIFIHLVESKLHLGFELGRIHDNAVKK